MVSLKQMGSAVMAGPAVFSGTLFLIFMAALILMPGFFAPYGYDEEDREQAYHPPQRIRFMDAADGFHMRPFVYGTQSGFDEYGQKTFEVNTRDKIYLSFFVRDKNGRAHLIGTQDGSVIYLLGSDWNGRCVLSRLIYGARVSLCVAVIAITISMCMGTFIGAFSGYVGGALDAGCMRLVEIIMSIPSFFLMLALRSVFPLTMDSVQIYCMVVLILSLLGWAGFARVVRGMVLAIKTKEYIVASEAVGMGRGKIVRRHILPATAGFVIVSAMLSLPSYIFGEAALSLLGLGITEPYASWGNMLSRAMNYVDMIQYPWILAPGAAIFCTVISCIVVGERMKDLVEVRSRV